jgi:predicted dehydrogenase
VASEPTSVGVIGCGNISGAYLKNMTRMPALRVAAVADLLPDRAAAKAREFNIPRAISVVEMLADPQIEVVVNLTVPKAHYEVALAALRAGKSVHNEKPLTITRAEGQTLLAEAKKRNVRVGCAPDTFLGAGIQTARSVLDEGGIGTPVAAVACMVCHGHEGWHPSPEFYYEVGGGPLFDMGPYYLTALVNLLGPVQRVCGAARISFPQRTITSEPKRGKVIKVETPTHIAGTLEFAAGPVATLIMSFDIWHASLPLIEVYGSTGSMSVPDPNGFGGPVRVRGQADKEWRDVPLRFPNEENSRGLGVADLAAAQRSGRPHRASGALAYHVLDIMHALHDSAASGKHVLLESTCERPAAWPKGLAAGMVE